MLFKSETTRRRITLIAGLLLAIGMGQSLISMFLASSGTAENTAQAVDTTAVQQVDLARGYEIVLEREPNNQTALRGLVEVHMARGELEQIIAPLEKLITLNPNEESYPALLATVKDELTQQKETKIEAPPAMP